MKNLFVCPFQKERAGIDWLMSCTLCSIAESFISWCLPEVVFGSESSVLGWLWKENTSSFLPRTHIKFKKITIKIKKKEMKKNIKRKKHEKKRKTWKEIEHEKNKTWKGKKHEKKKTEM